MRTAQYYLKRLLGKFNIFLCYNGVESFINLLISLLIFYFYKYTINKKIMSIYSLYLTSKFHHINYTFLRKIEKLKINL
jgi:hypothetical protein